MSGGRQGRNTPAYRVAALTYKTGKYTCHICGENPGTTVDHQPPLSNFPHPNLWHGQLLPACQPCQSKQGNQISQRNRRQKTRVVSRNW